jgi:hypothetical protein
MGWLRRGGHAPLAGGRSLTWSVAEGRRGTRWREVTTDRDAVRRAVLLEVSPAGRVTRLEIAGAAGLLTLHPEVDETALHGNVVTPEGIRHLALAWSAEHVILIAGSRVASAVGVGAAGGRALAVGETRDVAVVAVGDDLVPRAGHGILARTDHRSWAWRSDTASPADTVRFAADGGLDVDDGASWALED